MADDQISVQITADASGLQDAAAQASDAANQVSESLQNIGGAATTGAQGLDAAAGSVGAFASTLSTIGSIAAGVFGGLELENIAEKIKGTFEDATLGTFDWAESLTNLSISTGLTTDQLQVLQYAAGVTGVNMNRLQMTVNMVARAMQQYAEGTPRAVDAAKQLGVDPSTWTSAYDAVMQLGDAYTRLTADGRQLGLANEEAFQVFLGGRSGMQGLAAFKDLAQYEKEATDGGYVFGDAMVKNSDEAAQAINRLGLGWQKFEHMIGGVAAEGVLAIGRAVTGLGADLDEAGVGAADLEKGLSAAAQAAANLKAAATTMPMSAHGGGTMTDFLQSIKDSTQAEKDAERADKELTRTIAGDAREMETETDAAFGRIIEWHKEEAAEAQKAAKKDAESWADYDKGLAYFLNLTNEAKEPADRLSQALDNLDQALMNGDISMQEYVVASGALVANLEKVNEGAQKVSSEFNKQVTGAFRSTADEMLQMAFSSQTNVSAMQRMTQIGEQLTEALAKLVLEYEVLNPLINAANTAMGIGAKSLPAGWSLGGGSGGGNQPNSQLTQLISQGATTIAQDAAYYAQSLLQLSIIAINAVGKSIPIVGTLFEHGGIVPSAAGGMISGGGLSILHPREAVLPANITDGMIRAINGGTFGGGGGGDTINVNYNVSAMDGASVDRVLSQHGDVIANAVLSKMRNGRGVGQNINRGNFRR